MTRIRVALILAGIAVSALVFHAQTPAPQAAYKFTEIVPGVYSAIGTGTDERRLQLRGHRQQLKAIDFVDVIPGHGEAFKGKERADWFQAYLRDLWTQGRALHEQRVTAADAAKRIDMTTHKAHYPTITGLGVNLPAVSRMYEVMDGRADR